MKKPSKKDLLELKESIYLALEEAERNIVLFPSDGSDKDFNDLIKKVAFIIGIYFKKLSSYSKLLTQ